MIEHNLQSLATKERKISGLEVSVQSLIRGLRIAGLLFIGTLPVDATDPGRGVNLAGLGVALEYERMGNRPVSEDPQARADGFGFRFEHLGTTLGSVISDMLRPDFLRGRCVAEVLPLCGSDLV